MDVTMTDEKFKPSRQERFYRGVLFISAGVFMVVRFVARGDESLFFTYAAWAVGIIALLAFTLYLWSVFQNIDEL